MTPKELFSLEIKKDEKTASVEMAGTVPKEKIREVREQVLKKIGEEKKIDGFRDGKAPASVVEQTVGSFEVWQQSAQEVIMHHFAEIIAAEKLTPLGQPQLQLITVPDEGDVTFRVTFFTMPDIKLPDYEQLLRNIEKPEKAEEATDEEVEQVVLNIRRDLYRKAHPEKGMPDEDQLPDLTDEYIRNISEQYKDMESFLKGTRESITREKKMQARAVFRQKILNTILEKTHIVIPDIIIEEDSKRAYEDLKAHAQQFGTTVEEYLKSQNMDEPKLWEQLRKEAKKRSRMQLVMNAVSAKENIYTDKGEVEKEIERFKGKGHGMTDEQLHTYIESILTNEAVMQFLEKKVTG